MHVCSYADSPAPSDPESAADHAIPYCVTFIRCHSQIVCRHDSVGH